MNLEIKKDLTSNWFKMLQDSICYRIDKLEKINNRGKAETERAIQEEQLAEGNPQPERVQSPKGRMT